jgi:hypothetical protein
MKQSRFTRLLTVSLLLLLGMAIGLQQLAAQPNMTFSKLPLEAKLSEPMGIAFRPSHPNQLWVVNHGNDSIAILTNPGESNMEALVKTDAYAEHFVAKPTGIAFGYDDTFAVSNDSINELRGMKFIKNPERNQNFVKNHFMGPTLFSADTYALAGQSKKYLDDWPQPGNGHDPDRDLTLTQGCPLAYWNPTVQQCYWPREGSHLDMLHESPLAMGIAHDKHNAYFLLDGCGSRDSNKQCLGNGHLMRYDFNRDHQEGNGFHGDGIVWRYPEVHFKRDKDIPGGLLVQDGWLYFSNPGMGKIERIAATGGNIQIVVKSWSEQYAKGQVGSGVISWEDVKGVSMDGDEPEAISNWVKTRGDLAKIAELGKDWIAPMEVLSEYSYVYNIPQKTFISEGWLDKPSGLASDGKSLFVADYDSGWVAAFDLQTAKLRWRYQSNLKSISGLAFNPNKPRELYVSDRDTDSIYQLRWN